MSKLDLIDRVVEKLKQENNKNKELFGHIQLFDDGTVAYRSGNDFPIAFYDTLEDFVNETPIK